MLLLQNKLPNYNQNFPDSVTFCFCDFRKKESADFADLRDKKLYKSRVQGWQALAEVGDGTPLGGSWEHLFPGVGEIKY